MRRRRVRPILEAIAFRVKNMDPKMMERLGTVIGFAAIAALKLAEAVILIGIAAAIAIDERLKKGLAVLDFLSEVVAEMQNFRGMFFAAGEDIVQGLIDGITSIAPSAVATIAGLGDSLIGSIEAKLKVRSPSRVFEQIGEFTGLGFMQGLQSTDMNAAIANPISPSTAIAPMGGAAASGGGQQIVVHVDAPQIHVTSDNGHEVAKQTAASIGSELVSVLRGLATQAGG